MWVCSSIKNFLIDLVWVQNLFRIIQATNIRVEWIAAVGLIASSLSPDRMSSLSSQSRYVFAAREELINKLLVYMKDDIASKPTQLKASALHACAALVYPFLHFVDTN